MLYGHSFVVHGLLVLHGHSFVAQGLLCGDCLCCMVIHLLYMACSVVVACVVWSFICCARLALLWLLVLYGHSFVVHGLLCGGCLCYVVIF